MKIGMLLLLLALVPTANAYQLSQWPSEKRMSEFGEKYARLYWFSHDACDSSPETDKALTDLARFRRVVESQHPEQWAIWKKAESNFYKEALTWSSNATFCESHDQETALGWRWLRDKAATEGDIIDAEYSFIGAYFSSSSVRSSAENVAEDYSYMEYVATTVCSAYSTPKLNYLRAKLEQFKINSLRYPGDTAEAWMRGEKIGLNRVKEDNMTPSKHVCQQLDSKLFLRLGYTMKDSVMKSHIRGWWEWYGN
ncbi:MAG: hypothetical protein ACI9T7_003361 [Oleiphilaceae bacterium]|jgi:hypothetical protein